MLLGGRRLVVGLVVAAAGALACASPAAARTVSPRVVGGTEIPVTDAPWQVGIAYGDEPDAYAAQFCGGVIVDALHVITAAHCLDAEPPWGAAEPGNTRDVIAGMTDLSGPTGLPAQRVQIATWGGMPQFDLSANVPGPYDAALATLSQPLDFSQPGVRPAVLVGAGQLTPPGTALRVSGWGDTTGGGDYPEALHAADLFAVSDADCQATYGSDLDPTTMLCAIAPGKDSCAGDSGGPLTLTDGTLIGLVSWGPDPCADPSGDAGVYTELAQPTIAAFIRELGYAPPQAALAPVLAGVARTGETLTCQPGTWASGAPGSPEISWRFVTTEGLALRDWSTDATYALSDSDAGRRILCVERARDASGAATATSATSETVAGPPPGAGAGRARARARSQSHADSHAGPGARGEGQGRRRRLTAHIDPLDPLREAAMPRRGARDRRGHEAHQRGAHGPRDRPPHARAGAYDQRQADLARKVCRALQAPCPRIHLVHGPRLRQGRQPNAAPNAAPRDGSLTGDPTGAGGAPGGR